MIINVKIYNVMAKNLDSGITQNIDIESAATENRL